MTILEFLSVDLGNIFSALAKKSYPDSGSHIYKSYILGGIDPVAAVLHLYREGNFSLAEMIILDAEKNKQKSVEVKI